jgi:hypothetical protein
MAERRMFAKTIIDSDAFLDMPISSQNLYFHLGMRADDDGVINNPKSIMRLCGAKDVDMNLLIHKKFVLFLDDTVIVIKHWKINNYIQKDRYKPSKYLDLINSLSIDENGAYSEKKQECIQTGYEVDTQVSIGKVSIDNSNNTICANTQPNGSAKESKNKVEELFNKFWNEYPKKRDKAKCLKWFEKNKPNEQLVNKMLETIIRFKTYSNDWKRDNGQYIPYPLTWLNGGRWDDELTVEIRQEPLREDFKQKCQVIDVLTAEEEEILRKYGR